MFRAGATSERWDDTKVPRHTVGLRPGREGGPDIASSQTKRRLGSIRDWECRRESNMRYWLFMHSEWEPQTTWGVAVEVPSNLLKEDMQGSGRLLFMYMNFVTSTIMVLPFYLACH